MQTLFFLVETGPGFIKESNPACNFTQILLLPTLLTCHFSAGSALGVLSSVIGQADGIDGLISLLGVSDPQREDVVPLSHHVLAALKNGLLILQPLGLRSFRVCLAVKHDLASLLHLGVFDRSYDPQFF